MINCKNCGKNFRSNQDFFKHLHSNKCNSRRITKKNENDNLLSFCEKTEKKENPKIYTCKYCKRTYKYKSNHSRHLQTCQDRHALEHILFNQNFTIDEFLKIRDSLHDNMSKTVKNENKNIKKNEKNVNLSINQEIKNTNIIHNHNNLTNNINTTNNNLAILVNSQIIKNINPFGKENYEYILDNEDLCLKILKKMDYGINSLFFAIYNEEQNRNFYKAYTTKKTIAVLTHDLNISHNKYDYIIDIVFAKIHSIFCKIFVKYCHMLTKQEEDRIKVILDNYNDHGIIKSGNKNSFDNYLDYMSKDNKELITGYLMQKGLLKNGEKPMLGI